MQTNHIEAFRGAILSAGLTPPDNISDDGKLIRFNGTGKRGTTKDSWYVLYGDGVPAGVFGDWAATEPIKWTGKPDNAMTEAERQAVQARTVDAKEQRAKTTERKHANAQTAAAGFAEGSDPATPDHPYLAGREVQPHGLRVHGTSLVMPLYDMDGELWSVQFITSHGDKKFLPEGRVAGCFYPMGKSNGTTVICEGFATGASIREATDLAVLVAHSAGNLKAVAEALRAKHPDERILIAADDDWQTDGNPGLTKAGEAAQAAGATVVVPQFPERFEGLTDFNDLHREFGLEHVKAIFAPLVASGWPALDALKEATTPAPEPFPFEALGPILGSAARAIAEDVQAPDSLAGGSVLAAASLAVQPLANAMLPHGQRSPLSVFVITGAGSGDRKSAVDAVACKEVEEVRKDQARAHAKEMQKYEAEMGERKPKDPTPTKPAPQSITTANATIEGICKLLKFQSSLGIFSAEGGEMLGGHSLRDDKRSSGLAFYLKGWSGESLDSLRGGDGLTVLLGRRMAMHVLVQPVLLRELLCDPLAQGQGLLARCLIAEPQTLAGTRMYKHSNPHDNPDVIAYNERISTLLTTTPACWETGDGYELKPRDLYMGDDARALWIAFYNVIEGQQANGSELDGARPFASKAAEHAARIAGIITMVENPQATHITSEAMDGAIQLTAFYLNEHLRLTGAGRQEREEGALRSLLEWMQGRGTTVAKKDVLQRTPRAIRDLKAAGINAMLSDLVARGYIREAGDVWEMRSVQT
jgi:putative DNA primase/helicase